MGKNKNKAKGEFFELQKQSFDRCLHYSMTCKNKPIRAHSIQNGKVLDLLHKDNHVIMPRPKLVGDEVTIEMEPIGRNAASTFTGLCSEHDNELFKLADTLPLDVKNADQLNEYAYRAVMREMHTLLQEAGKMFTLEADKVKRGEIPANTINAAGVYAIDHCHRAWRLFRYRVTMFDKPRLEKKSPQVEHQIIELQDQTPTVASSSAFSIGEDANGDFIEVMLSVVPVNDKQTTCIVSYAIAHAAKVKKALPKLFDESDKKQAISEAILQRAENFVLSPTAHDGWSKEKQEAVVKFFSENLTEVKDPQEGADILLF